MGSVDVNGLPLPSLLVDMLRSGQWCHPGDAVIRKLIPLLTDPVDFLTSIDRMRRESPKRMAGDREMERIFHFVSDQAGVSDLPWLDVNRAVFIAVCRFAGDDTAIALDYRTDANDPRVVASAYDDTLGYRWIEVAPSFSAFVKRFAAERVV
jgi:hypothetical protein